MVLGYLGCSIDLKIFFLYSLNWNTLTLERQTMIKTELVALLERHQIPLEKWGKEEAKSVAHLAREIENGEVRLQVTKYGLTKSSRVVVLKVYHRSPEGLFFLREDRQEFKNGRIRRRPFNTSLSEKLKRGETALRGAKRALEEELGIKGDLILTPLKTERIEPHLSFSYPGLFTKWARHVYEVYLPTEFFIPTGYKEEQEDKTTYFLWERIKA